MEFGYLFGLTPGVTITSFYAVEAAKLRLNGFGETITLSFGSSSVRKGVTHASTIVGTIDDAARTSILKAIAYSQYWIEIITAGDVSSFGEIAALEKLDERTSAF